MYNIICQARVVVNIHYYDGALLETPRICECISLGVPVLSEGLKIRANIQNLKAPYAILTRGQSIA